MSNETKRDVFEDAAFNIETSSPDGLDFACELRQRYAAALPDDLPVIPKAVGEWIRRCKGKGGASNVSDAMIYAQGSIATWLYNERHSDVFARAWVLGVWKVKKTGEIVKLEDGE